MGQLDRDGFIETEIPDDALFGFPPDVCARIRTTFSAIRRPATRLSVMRALRAGLGRRPDPAVAADVDLSPFRLRVYRARLGIALTDEAIVAGMRRRTVDVDDRTIDRLRECASTGLSLTRIAWKLGLSDRRVRALAARHGITILEQGARRRPLPRGNRAAALPERYRRYRAALFGERLERVDWSRSDFEIAQTTGFAIRTVRGWRLRFRKEGRQLHEPPGRYRRPPWHLVDWTRGNLDIAAQYGVTHGMVSVWRREYRRQGLTVPPSKHRERYLAARIQRYGDSLRKLAREGRCATDIGRELGISRRSVRTIARAMGVQMKLPHRRFDWSGVDWSRRNKDIARDLHTCTAVVSMKRLNLRRAGAPIPPSPGLKRIDWASVDWTLSNPEIAGLVGAACVTVSARRLLLRTQGMDIPAWFTSW